MRILRDIDAVQEIKNNDPDLTEVWIDKELISSNVDLGEAANAISQNLHIFKIYLENFSEPDTIQRYVPIFKAISNSKTIKDISFIKCILGGDLLSVLQAKHLDSISIEEFKPLI